MAAKVIIKRYIKERKEAEVLALLKKFRFEAMHQPGYISGETLRNHYDPRSVMVIATWQSVENWIRWQESAEREANEAQLESLLEGPTQYEVYDLGG